MSTLYAAAHQLVGQLKFIDSSIKQTMDSVESKSLLCKVLVELSKIIELLAYIIVR